MAGLARWLTGFFRCLDLMAKSSSYLAIVTSYFETTVLLYLVTTLVTTVYNYFK